MKSDEWVTLQKAVLKLCIGGVEESVALFGLQTAMDNGEIASRNVQHSGSKTSWESTELVELRSYDIEKWRRGVLGLEATDRGGRPPKYDWNEFNREIIRIANKPDGLPETQAELIEIMRDWTEKNWRQSPGDTMLKKRVSDIYAQCK